MINSSDKSASYTALFKKYFAPFCVYALSFVQDKEVAKDIVSDVFVSLWIKQEDIDFESKLIAAYIKTSVRNRAINYLIQQRTEGKHKESIVEMKEQELYSEEHVYTTFELYELLEASLNKLPKRYRLIFVKRYLEGKKNIEIADELNLSTKSIERYNQKILAFLRKELKDYEFLLLLMMLHSL